jgi:hypothetical protein
MGMIVNWKKGRFNDYGRGSKRGNDCGKGNGRMTVVWEGGRGE